MRQNGIKVISINEPIDQSPSGQLLEGMIETMDEFYSANLGQDIKRGMRENAGRGFFNGSRPPYGFHKIEVQDGAKTRHKLEPDPEGSAAVQVIRKIFDMAMAGKGCKEIAKSLNHDCYRTSLGQPWTKTTVHKVLTNEAYCGTLVWAGRRGYPAARSGVQPVRVEDAWPPIVGKDVFRTVQSMMTAKAPAVAHPRTVYSHYLLSGLIFCSCGGAMTGCSAKSHQYHYYTCSKSGKQGKEACDARILPQKNLERLIVDQLRRKVLADDYVEELVNVVNDELMSAHHGLRGRLDTVDAELKDVSLRLSRHYDALETNTLKLSDVAPRIQELRRRHDELTKTRIQVEADMIAEGAERLDLMAVKAHVHDLKSLLTESDVARSKAFLRSFVKRIEVAADKVTLWYKLPLPAGSGKKDNTEVLPIVTSGGAEGIRTPDLLLAKQALSRLSYSPHHNITQASNFPQYKSKKKHMLRFLGD